VASYTFKVDGALKDQRLDKVVHALLADKVAGGISKSLARKLVMIGACYLNGSRCRIASKPVFKGSEVRVEYNPEKVRSVQLEFPSLTEKDILYKEGGLIVVNKPANLPTVPTLDNARDNLIAALHQLLGKEQYIGIHHRLDAPTSGCLLFTTDEAMNSFAAKLFQENLIQKEYLAVCTGGNPPPQKTWEVKNQLARAEKKRNRYESTKGEGDFAYSRFELLDQKGKLLLIKAQPITGRTHQLRVHLAEQGLPVLGDKTYGGEEAARLMLHAHRLTFRAPSGTDVTIEAAAPPEFKRLFGL
jgi:RluA family pseudouridine synthase